ncbi:hypothetical protein BD626DRAFT_497297 [Schizophyllum amplum]|uniref:Uncharacterized protein n=1 Tax=Schizophyllum amplum TaxID=97359 RepID=A0A550CE00_9AGAR|nr:hypothetical protein BD626DRAFT_497297 [Auriculariopsis ampla]
MMKIGIRIDDTGREEREGGKGHPCATPIASHSSPATSSSIIRALLPSPTSLHLHASETPFKSAPSPCLSPPQATSHDAQPLQPKQNKPAEPGCHPQRSSAPRSECADTPAPSMPFPAIYSAVTPTKARVGSRSPAPFAALAYCYRFVLSTSRLLFQKSMVSASATDVLRRVYDLCYTCHSSR